jgi:CheY-like chemotaxis protein
MIGLELDAVAQHGCDETSYGACRYRGNSVFGRHELLPVGEQRAARLRRLFAACALKKAPHWNKTMLATFSSTRGCAQEAGAWAISMERASPEWRRENGVAVVLVVEDEWLVRMEIAEALDGRGWNVVEASTGEAALALLEEKSPIDLVVTDIRLPGAVSGWEVAEAFRAANREVAVIYCSGNPVNSTRQVSGSVFLAKPFRTDALLAAGEKLCPRQIPPR